MKNKESATGTSEAHAAAVIKACALLEASASAPDLTSLAKGVHMSASNFHRVFRSLTGLTPKAYAAALRSKRVRKELAAGASVTDALYAAADEALDAVLAYAAEQSEQREEDARCVTSSRRRWPISTSMTMSRSSPAITSTPALS
ncbi:MAG TPA: helix-turn-helix domain-containing protein, partial [Candidatus Peribacteria bacterium]|nr:helix-turn-helix domain-containing protein [Candidatus Peribacteria bacterium]